MIKKSSMFMIEINSSKKMNVECWNEKTERLSKKSD